MEGTVGVILDATLGLIASRAGQASGEGEGTGVVGGGGERCGSVGIYAIIVVVVYGSVGPMLHGAVVVWVDGVVVERRDGSKGRVVGGVSGVFDGVVVAG